MKPSRHFVFIAFAGALFAASCSAQVTVSPKTNIQTLREGIPISTPAAEGISDAALTTLITNATGQKSDAVIILRNGKLVYENYFGAADSPIMAMSASKSFVGLTFGYLLADQRLSSLDDRVVAVRPTFGNVDPRKSAITYRQLLSQSSGLDPTRAGGSAGDIDTHAIESRVLFPPGTGWQYSNQGIDFLADLAGYLSGKPMDQYLNEKLFIPMGITSVSWYHDTRGVPRGAGEMSIRPLDLAKVGQAILDGGVWQGKAVIPPGWMTQSTAPSTTFAPNYGLLWWRLVDHSAFGITSDLLAQWRSMGATDSTVAKLQPLSGNSYRSPSELEAAEAARLTTAEYSTFRQWLAGGDHFPYYRVLATSPLHGFAAEGWLGQYLLVCPDKKIVAVRMRRAVAADYASLATEVNGYGAFASDVYRLVP